MLKYVVKRLLYAIPVFLGITFVIYLLINLAPGGPLAILASSGEMSQADLEAMKVTLGLDKPIVVRYFLWLVDLFRGDLGTSYRTSQDVAMMISQRIIPSLTLTGVVSWAPSSSASRWELFPLISRTPSGITSVRLWPSSAHRFPASS